MLNTTTLAEKLVNFYENFDFYGFKDTLEIGETKEDAAKKIAADLQDSKLIDLIIEELEGIISEGITDENDVKVAKEIIEELKIQRKEE